MNHRPLDFTQTSIFPLLEAEARKALSRHLREWKEEDRTLVSDRFLFDFSTTHLTGALAGYFAEALEELDFDRRRHAMFVGEPVNVTENRPALHTAWRMDPSDYLVPLPSEVVEYVIRMRDQVKRLSDRFRSGEWKGATGKPLRRIVNIGIGGSHLGPEAVIRALENENSFPVTFLSNVDGRHTADVLSAIDPETTLFVVVSKSFGTLETLTNAHTTIEFLKNKLGHSGLERHVVAVTAAPGRIAEAGIPASHVLPLSEWTGGRFSLWSVAGISIPLALGFETFDRLLEGAREADKEFYYTPSAFNIAVVWAMVHLLYRHFGGASTEAYVPYRQRLALIKDHFQQLFMESLGKSVRLDGTLADYPVGSVIWGGPGTNAQHSFFQFLHQAPEVVPVYFLGTVKDDHPYPHHDKLLIANLLAQREALAYGKPQTGAFDYFPGNRPSVTLLFDRLDAYHLGYLLALAEHKVFTESVFWGINPFDQPGVELGKILAKRIARQLEEVSAKEENKILKFVRKNLKD
ncbi:MAG: glucose-6-phosphate isomerase [Chlorobi bacterium]|nr:glucose-6-phosphate isomerase [Chlorobiota bacterium]